MNLFEHTCLHACPACELPAAMHWAQCITASPLPAGPRAWEELSRCLWKHRRQVSGSVGHCLWLFLLGQEEDVAPAGRLSFCGHVSRFFFLNLVLERPLVALLMLTPPGAKTSGSRAVLCGLALPALKVPRDSEPVADRAAAATTTAPATCGWQW